MCVCKASWQLNGKETACSAGAAGDTGLFSGWDNPLEEEMATHSSIQIGRAHV